MDSLLGSGDFLGGGDFVCVDEPFYQRKNRRAHYADSAMAAAECEHRNTERDTSFYSQGRTCFRVFRFHVAVALRDSSGAAGVAMEMGADDDFMRGVLRGIG